MPSPENPYSINDLFKDIRNVDTYEAAIVGRGLEEIYKSGKFASYPIPEGSVFGSRTINAVHMAADIGDSINLLEFIPEASSEYQETLQRILRERLLEIDLKADVEDQELINAISLAKKDGLHVLGAFQISTLDSGKRTTEIFFPLAFAKQTRSIARAVAISASILRYVQ